MKIDFKKMQNKNFYIYLNGDKPKNDSDVVNLLRTCVHSLKQAQACRCGNNRFGNTLGESWAVDAIEELIDCMEVKR